jgi:hypothetical protein
MVMFTQRKISWLLLVVIICSPDLCTRSLSHLEEVFTLVTEVSQANVVTECQDSAAGNMK